LEGPGFIGGLNLMSTQDEVRLGQQVAAEVERQEPVLQNPEVQAHVRDIGERLAAVSPRRDVIYTFKVIDAPNTVNAFALPGGPIYVYTGLMDLCASDAELAAVLAHEIAHIAARHHGEMMTRQVGMQVISDVILGQNPHAAAQIASQLFAAGVSARYSRVQEREADSLGMDILYRAGYPPDAMISFMFRLMEYDRSLGGRRSLPIFATHPAPEERIQLLQELRRRYP